MTNLCKNGKIDYTAASKKIPIRIKMEIRQFSEEWTPFQVSSFVVLKLKSATVVNSIYCIYFTHLDSLWICFSFVFITF